MLIQKPQGRENKVSSTSTHKLDLKQRILLLKILLIPLFLKALVLLEHIQTTTQESWWIKGFHS